MQVVTNDFAEPSTRGRNIGGYWCVKSKNKAKLSTKYGQARSVVAFSRLLDLDDPGAHVGQHHRAIRAGENAGEIEDRQTVQRCHIVGTSMAQGLRLRA